VVLSAPNSGPSSGYALVVVRRDAETTIWWGANAHVDDAVATRDGRVLAWASTQDCFAVVAETMDPTPPALEWHPSQRRCSTPSRASTPGTSPVIPLTISTQDGELKIRHTSTISPNVEVDANGQTT
jgi:hypothetical protein